LALLAFLAPNVDQHIGRLAKLLEGDLAEAEPPEAVAQIRELGRPVGADLDQNAAGEVNAVVETSNGEQDERTSDH
jgi:hypothetical protein